MNEEWGGCLPLMKIRPCGWISNGRHWGGGVGFRQQNHVIDGRRS